MKKSTKLLSVLLAVLMILSSLSIAASAAKTNYKTVANLESLSAYNNYGTVTRLSSEERFSIVLDELDRSDIPLIEKELGSGTTVVPVEETTDKGATIVVSDKPSLDDFIVPGKDATADAVTGRATISDLSEGLKKMAEEPAPIGDTIILK